MSAKYRTSGENTILNKLFGRNRKASRKSGRPANRRSRKLQMEGLENREMFAVSAIGLNGYGVLQVNTDNNATSVTVGKVGTNIRIQEVGTTRFWDYSATSVGRVDFVGGAGNDRFVNNVSTMPTRAWGLGGDDYLEGYNAVDYLMGGENNDTLVGYGSADQMFGGGGNDLIRGMAGDDTLVGDAGNDHIDGGSEHDKMWGGTGDDTLLGGAGMDELYGDENNDQLNGQHGWDRMWGGTGNDVLISIDGAYGEDVDGGSDADTLWIDGLSTPWGGGFTDYTYGVSSIDVVQKVGSFANGADLTLDADNIADPSDIGSKLRFTNTISANNIRGSNPLFAGPGIMMTSSGMFLPTSAGPKDTDVKQGDLKDCWIMGSLSAIANKSPQLITQNVVDFNDGTYGVRLGNSFYRVDNELAVKNTASGAVTSNLRYAELGSQNSMWVAIVEKAFAAYRSTANTYIGLDWGTEEDVFRAFRMNSVGSYEIKSIYGSATYMANDFYNRSLNGYAQTISVTGNSGNNHVFTVHGFTRNAAGAITGIVLRDPYGRDRLDKYNVFAGASTGSSTTDGVITVSISQLFNSGGWTDWAHA